MAARPFVYWHWMGPNFSKEGITKDLEAMKAAGIGGATIFNLASGLTPYQTPIADTLWPEHTYRSPAYWDCVRHAAEEGKRLGIEIGLHNTVGYNSTGGPWIRDDQGIMRVVRSETPVTGGSPVKVKLQKPAAPVNGGPGGTPPDAGKFCEEIAVMAIPVLTSISAVPLNRVIDLTSQMSADGQLDWPDAPEVIG